jgi:hypothetical protein
MRESVVENYLVKRVKVLGGEVRKCQWIGRRGAPDRLVMLPKKHFFVELKAPGVEPEDYQLREHERMRQAGFEVLVIDTKAGVDAMVARCMQPQAYALLGLLCESYPLPVDGRILGDRLPKVHHPHIPRRFSAQAVRSLVLLLRELLGKDAVIAEHAVGYRLSKAAFAEWGPVLLDQREAA